MWWWGRREREKRGGDREKLEKGKKTMGGRKGEKTMGGGRDTEKKDIKVRMQGR